MKYFGTDGIRGVPNEKLTPTLVTKMGMALSVLECKEVVIATDTRLSKDMLWTSLATGAMSVGLNVKYVGVMPTPALIYYSFKHKVTGVIITASHNPYTDNGIKILNRGYKLNETEEFQIEEYIDACNESFVKPKIGCLEMIDVKKEYYQFLQNHMHKTNLKIAIDCANGATSVTAPEIFKEITDQLIVISNQPDGYNINKDCGSTHLNLLIKTVVDHNCDLGFAFDGDGDRVLCVDSNGKIIDGDKLIYLLALYLKSKGKLRKNMVVLSIMSNLGLIESLSQHGIHAIETNVGDKYIIEALNNNKLSLGGENSGHI
ncbi:MAG TPA: phosphoglucosamine mutase, partial [Candidatus Pelethenecus sp.]|nr:phosphoglucosamine mutase [Candidatus Pelethenecus sp.]